MIQAATALEASRPIRAVVVDDEPLACSTISLLLRRDPDVEVVAECAGGAEALDVIRRAKPELVFLDVEMPECGGFDVLEQLGGDAPAAVVFVTAYDAYALRAFEAGALDYLLKPFDDARFARALARAKRQVADERRTHRTPHTLVVKSAGKIAFVKVADIDWIEAADYYCRLHTGAATHLLRRSIADLTEELDDSTFCRIHRSTIVRFERIRRLEINESGEYDVLLDDETRLRSSRRYRNRLQLLLKVRREDVGSQ